MISIRKLSKKWAVYVSGDKYSLATSLFLSICGIFNVLIYLFGSTNNPAILATGIFLIGTSFLLFERAGFVNLLEEHRNKQNFDKPEDRNFTGPKT